MFAKSTQTNEQIVRAWGVNCLYGRFCCVFFFFLRHSIFCCLSRCSCGCVVVVVVAVAVAVHRQTNECIDRRLAGDVVSHLICMCAIELVMPTSSSSSQWMAWNQVDYFTNRFRFPFAYTRLKSTHRTPCTMSNIGTYLCVSVSLNVGWKHAQCGDRIRYRCSRISCAQDYCNRQRSDLYYFSIRWEKSEMSMQWWICAGPNCACTPNVYDCDF